MMGKGVVVGLTHQKKCSSFPWSGARALSGCSRLDQFCFANCQAENALRTHDAGLALSYPASRLRSRRGTEILLLRTPPFPSAGQQQDKDDRGDDTGRPVSAARHVVRGETSGGKDAFPSGGGDDGDAAAKKISAQRQQHPAQPGRQRQLTRGDGIDRDLHAAVAGFSMDADIDAVGARRS